MASARTSTVGPTNVAAARSGVSTVWPRTLRASNGSQRASGALPLRIVATVAQCSRAPSSRRFRRCRPSLRPALQMGSTLAETTTVQGRRAAGRRSSPCRAPRADAATRSTRSSSRCCGRGGTSAWSARRSCGAWSSTAPGAPRPWRWNSTVARCSRCARRGRWSWPRAPSARPTCCSSAAWETRRSSGAWASGPWPTCPRWAGTCRTIPRSASSAWPRSLLRALRRRRAARPWPLPIHRRTRPSQPRRGTSAARTASSSKSRASTPSAVRVTSRSS
mmetsp:Transcript_6036/g.17841  ORF Transcript_6036/g.17841 Transcript_6036/m.17841 type:complete len:277 (-) Transcript_6036:872-1702(-)